MGVNHAIVIDEDGYKVEFVLTETQDDGNFLIHGYELKDNESLIFNDISTACSMLKPRWDGSKWEETGERIITSEDMEQLRTAKLQMVNAVAQQSIYSGVTIGDDIFSLTEVDQINISTLVTHLQAALKGEPSVIDPVKGVPYHANGKLCRYWLVDEFMAITQAATAHVFYHQTYCNHLRAYIKDIRDYDELEAVSYGMELPLELATSMASLLGV